MLATLGSQVLLGDELPTRTRPRVAHHRDPRVVSRIEHAAWQLHNVINVIAFCSPFLGCTTSPQIAISPAIIPGPLLQP